MSRPRRQTREELEAALRMEQSHCFVNQMCLTLHLDGGPQATIRGKQHYTARIYGAERADGGYVAVTWAPPGQHASTAAYYLERWVNEESTRFIPKFEGYELEHALRELAQRVKETAWALAEKAREIGLARREAAAL